MNKYLLSNGKSKIWKSSEDMLFFNKKFIMQIFYTTF